MKEEFIGIVAGIVWQLHSRNEFHSTSVVPIMVIYYKDRLFFAPKPNANRKPLCLCNRQTRFLGQDKTRQWWKKRMQAQAPLYPYPCYTLNYTVNQKNTKDQNK